MPSSKGIAENHRVEPDVKKNNEVATPAGFEPAISTVTGWHVRPLHHGATTRVYQSQYTLSRQIPLMMLGNTFNILGTIEVLGNQNEQTDIYTFLCFHLPSKKYTTNTIADETVSATRAHRMP